MGVLHSVSKYLICILIPISARSLVLLPLSFTLTTKFLLLLLPLLLTTTSPCQSTTSPSPLTQTSRPLSPAALSSSPTSACVPPISLTTTRLTTLQTNPDVQFVAYSSHSGNPLKYAGTISSLNSQGVEIRTKSGKTTPRKAIHQVGPLVWCGGSELIDCDSSRSSA